MIDEARRFDPTFRISVTTGLRPLPPWKREADAVFVQAAFSATLLAWASGRPSTARSTQA